MNLVLLSVSPVVLQDPGRIVDMQLKLSAPISRHDILITLLSRGHERPNNPSSMDGYSPLVGLDSVAGYDAGKTDDESP